MHLIFPSPLFDSFSRGEKVFLENWFNLTHPRSLDSYRVRCHNGRTILKELHREMVLGVANTDDMLAIFLEAKHLCSTDSTASTILGSHRGVLEHLLSKLSGFKGDKRDVMTNSPEWIQLGFVLVDLLPTMPARYLTEAISGLKAAIIAEDDELILKRSGALATELAERGWSLESLHAWIETAFLANSGKTFVERFDAFGSRLSRPPENFEVILSLSGSAHLQTLGDFCGFSFSKTGPVTIGATSPTAKNLSKFLHANAQKAFALTNVTAVDQFSAAHAALEKFALCLDRLRFNLCPLPLSTGKHALVTRASDQKRKLLPLVFRIPNPAHTLPLTLFATANKKLDKMLGLIEGGSQMRIEAAARQCRLGCDGRAYQDMLLNWWMGLETLTSPGEGKGIGQRVFKNAVPLLCHRYTIMQLRHLAYATKEACVSWPHAVIDLLKCLPGKEISWKQMLSILQNSQAVAAVLVSIARHPWLEYQFRKFSILLTDPKRFRDHLKSHKDRVRWHLMRLYRIRCCLVHGTPLDTALQLPAANLEFYLREAVVVVISALDRASHLKSVENVFSRALYAAERCDTILGSAGANLDSIREAIESEITFSLA